ncbi:MAG: cyclic-di-AMP receptor [Chloroflexi bacterium]|nr:cyclic-di-AMP receptor [Chloroflexota bacterium]
MKLLLAIVRDDFAADVTFALNNQGFSVTRISSTGGFWRRGNVTLLIGVEDRRTDEALRVINEHAGPAAELGSAPKSHPPSRATIFVLDVDAVERY